MMNRGWKAAACFLGSWILLTAVLFPGIRAVVDAVAPGMFNPPRIFGRVQMVLALLGGAGLLFYWKDGPQRFFGAKSWSSAGFKVARWGLLGAGMVAAGAWLQSFLGVRTWAGVPGVDLWAGALATGALVAVLEEFFFRGVLGLAFWRAAGEKPAAWLIGVNAAIFSAAHFLRPQAELGQGWLSGFRAWTNLELWAGPADPWRLAGLFVAGLILARLAWQQQSLWAAIGLHAGWVAGLRISGGFWKESPQVSGGWWGPSLEAGPIPFVLLLLLAFTLWGRPIRARLD